VHGKPEAYLSRLGDDKFCRQLHMADILKDLQELWTATGRSCLIIIISSSIIIIIIIITFVKD
jgi:hypothetical protein